MSGSLNKVILVGNLGRDPEIRSTQNGDKVANLSIATSERWRDRDNQIQERTEWHRVVIFGRVAEIAERYLKKGSKVLVEGKLQTRRWTDNAGQERYTTEVVLSGFGENLTMLDRPSDRDNEPDNFSGSKKNYEHMPQINDVLDDLVPF